MKVEIELSLTEGADPDLAAEAMFVLLCSVGEDADAVERFNALVRSVDGWQSREAALDDARRALDAAREQNDEADALITDLKAELARLAEERDAYKARIRPYDTRPADVGAEAASRYFARVRREGKQESG